MQKIILADETFDKHQASSYHLSIQLAPDAFSFCVLDTVRNKYILLKQYPIKTSVNEDVICDQLSDILKEDDILGLCFAKCRFMVLNNMATLVPEKFFEVSKAKSILELNRMLNDYDEIHYNLLPEAGAVQLFPVSSNILNVIRKTVKQITLYHHNSVFINASLASSSAAEIHAFISSGFIDVLATDKQKLLSNTMYTAKNENDWLYYIVHTLKKQNMDALTTKVFVSGDIISGSAAFELLKQYLPELRIEKLPSKYSFSYTFSALPCHNYLNLYNLGFCA